MAFILNTLLAFTLLSLRFPLLKLTLAFFRVKERTNVRHHIVNNGLKHVFRHIAFSAALLGESFFNAPSLANSLISPSPVSFDRSARFSNPRHASVSPQRSFASSKYVLLIVEPHEIFAVLAPRSLKTG